MGIAEAIAFLTSFFKFFPEVSKFIKMLQKTPEQKHSELMDKIQKEAEAYAKPGSRPEW